MAQRAFDIVINVDTTKADRQLNSFEKEIKKTQKELKSAQSDIQSLGSNSTNISNFTKSTTEASREVSDLQDELKDAQSSFSDVSKSITKTEKKLEDFEKEVNQTQDALQKLGANPNNLRNFGDAANDASIDVKELQKELGEVSSSFGSIGSAAGAANSQFSELTGALGGLTQAYTALTFAGNDLANVGNTVAESQDILSNSLSVTQSDMEFLINDFENGEISAADFAASQGVLQHELDRTSQALRVVRTRMLASRIAMVAIGAGAVLAATQIAKMTTNLATLAQTDVTTIQQFGFATSQFGLNMDQAANILKDFNDRVGDFVVTGGGPMVDVMERLGKETGLTAEKLASLSGPDALILLKKSMDDANLSMQEQTFLLESLGSDLTLLLPLLENNGQAYKDLTASIAGVQASEPAIASLTATSNEFNRTIEVLKGLFMEIAGVVAPLVTAALFAINEVLSVIVKGVKLAAAGVLLLSAELADLFGADKDAEGLRKQMDAIFASIEGVSAVAKDAKVNVDALRKLQDSRSTKAIGELQKQIDGQVQLASAIGISVTEYERVKTAVANVAAQEKLRADLTKQNLRPEQIEAQIAQLKRLQTVQATVATAVKLQTDAETKAAADREALKQTTIDLAKAEQDRLTSISDFITDLEYELALTKATTDAERDAIATKRELKSLDADPDQAAHIEYLKKQIALQKEANDAVEKSIAINIKSIESEIKRADGVAKFETTLRNQLELLQAKTEEERKSIAFRQQLDAMDLKGNEGEQLQAIQNQIDAQERLNKQLQEQKDAYTDLGASVREWALGSEDAIASVITQLLRLVAIQFGVGDNPFVQGFFGGMKGFANGGDFNAGETFMVGEKGPEIMTARSPGTVIPNHQLGGSANNISQNISLSINGSIVASEELDRKFEEFAGAVADSTQNLLRNQLRTGGVLA